MDAPPRSTILMVPRDTFSGFPSSMENVARHRENGARMLVLDAGSPARVRRRLADLAVAHDVALIRVDPYLSPNEARNLAMRYVTTEFAVFIDNDARVEHGWLEALETCATETGAALVAPVTMSAELGVEEVHQAGGAAHVEDVDGKRMLRNSQAHRGKQVSDLATSQRSVTEEGEFHGLLTDCDWFRRVGGLDEAFLSLYDHTDFRMRVREAGGTVWAEPGSVVTYGRPRFIDWRDVPFYVLRWSDAWNHRSCERLVEAWELDIDPTVGVRQWATTRRRYAYRPYTTPFNRAGRLGRPVVDLVDRVAQGRVVSAWERSRGAGRRVEVVHAASWNARSTVP
jgi:hypothetical protein